MRSGKYDSAAPIFNRLNTHACILGNCLKQLTRSQQSVSADHRYSLNHNEILSDGSSFSLSLRETPALQSQWDALHGFQQSPTAPHFQLHMEAQACSLLSSDVCALVNIILGILCSFTTQTDPISFHVALFVGTWPFPDRISATSVTKRDPRGASLM